jgi:hypothetical protein
LDIFKDYFKNINECSDRFTNLIFVQTLENDGVIFTAKEDPVYLVQIARVIEEEEKRDKKRKKETGKVFSSKKKTAEVTLKNFRERLFKIMVAQVKSGIEYAMKDSPKFHEKLRCVDRYMTEILEDAELDVSACFPDEYNILQFYLKTFEDYVKDYVQNLLNDPEKLEYSESLELGLI